MIGLSVEEINELLVGCSQKLGIDYNVPTSIKSTEEKDIEEINQIVKPYRRVKEKSSIRQYLNVKKK